MLQSLKSSTPEPAESQYFDALGPIDEEDNSVRNHFYTISYFYNLQSMCLLYFFHWFAFGVDRNLQITTASWKILKTPGKMWKIPMMTKAVPLSEGGSEAAAVGRPPPQN